MSTTSINRFNLLTLLFSTVYDDEVAARRPLWAGHKKMSAGQIMTNLGCNAHNARKVGANLHDFMVSACRMTLYWLQQMGDLVKSYVSLERYPEGRAVDVIRPQAAVGVAAADGLADV
ncbi:hypothetical protein Acr_15g0004290 [Actinidia rufa]|uniref:Uncharacterized protein n=1 Tax=Actinidia rufa TaxID=165716 RepID=A0A7J0FUG8_9ERIC|nr:hypothetical protein Acr_15g0004290 [Actinidia rufa]